MSSIVRSALFAAAVFSCIVLRAVPAAAQSATDWPVMGRDASHSSYVADPNLSSSGASSMGVAWMANLYSADLGSPVAAFNAALNKTVAYVGNERGDIFAVDVSNGQMLWSASLGYNDSVRATPAIAPDGSVWVGTAYNPTLFKLDGATGQVLCSHKTGTIIDASPIVVTPPGGSTTVYVGTNNNGGLGPVYAINENDCSTSFQFSSYVNAAASTWTTPAYIVNANSEPLILFGSTDPDKHGYAIDANTGAAVWNFAPPGVPAGDYDFGSAATIGAAGANGFSGGAAYFEDKYGMVYAIDPASGNVLWQYSMFAQGFNGARDARSAAALDGNMLVMGYQKGVDAIDASSGLPIWQYPSPAEVISSPAIAGGAGSEIVAFGDLTGSFRVVALANGAPLYSYQTHGYITASPAVINGTVLLPSSDGFLYAYAIGGSNAPAPASAIASPANLSQVANPNGNLTVSGSSTDANGVSAVEVAVQSNGASGLWYNAATGSYGTAPVRNAAVVANPGATSTTWSFQFPAPPGGGAFQVFANTVNLGRIADRGTSSSFSILPSNSEAILTSSSAFAAPGGGVNVTGHSFAVGEKVSISIFGKVVATETAKAGTGYIPTKYVRIPPTAAFGPTNITATGLTSGLTATVVVGITNEWSQGGAGSTRVAFEPHDFIINNALDVGSSTVISQSWSYNTGAPVNSSPAVVNGIAYFGNDAGVLSAVLTTSGAPLWTYAVPGGTAIHTTPAIDANGNVVFGADDGNLYVLNANGALVQTIAIGGKLTSPAVAGNQVFVSSGSGNLYALNDVTGAVAWTQPLGGPSVSAPSYDAAASLVVVGDNAGNVTAFNSSTGTQAWIVPTGGPVSASPAIQLGLVAVGSQDGNMYAIGESSGTVNWKYAADSPILAGAAMWSGNTAISFGTQKGTMYLLDASGRMHYALAGAFKNSPIVGVSAVTGNAIAETANGFIGALRGMNNGQPVWTYQSDSSFSTAPAIIDGALYVTSNDGNLFAFTPHGANPTPAILHRGPIVTITDAWTCSTP